MKKRLLTYPWKVDHRVSVFVFIKLWLKAAWHALLAARLRPLPESSRFCFIAGCGNSGTTLLASKLGLHPDALLISRESNLFFPSRSLRLARIITSEWLAFARQEARRVILEKSPKHVHALARIHRLLPEARRILVVRNPLDTCASLYKRFGDLDFAIERWLMDNRALLAASQSPHTLLVRYETLTREPAATLQSACTFLGLEWDPELLSREGSAYGSHQGLRPNMAIRHAQVSQPIHDNNGKWVDVLDAAQAELVRQRTAELARQLGYTFDSI